jgi:hypothetical protein
VAAPRGAQLPENAVIVPRISTPHKLGVLGICRCRCPPSPYPRGCSCPSHSKRAFHHLTPKREKLGLMPSKVWEWKCPHSTRSTWRRIGGFDLRNRHGYRTSLEASRKTGLIIVKGVLTRQPSFGAGLPIIVAFVSAVAAIIVATPTLASRSIAIKRPMMAPLI